MRNASCLGALLALAHCASANVASATVTDPAFSESVHLAGTGMAGTTAMAWAPDGSDRLFYARQNGTLRVYSGGVLWVFASFSPLYASGECGVLGLAFDPNYVVNHYLYVFVTVSAGEQQIIRLTDDGGIGKDPTVIVAGLPTRGGGHNAGGIGFGPDGKLYWSIGDLGAHIGSADDLSSVASKISRVNVDGSAPLDNPFVDGDGPQDDRIWASGFRNPFTFTWRPSNGELWVNTVGSWHEQIFTPRAGDNAGWPTYENNQPQGYLAPILAYPTGGETLSIAAGGASRLGGVATFATTAPHSLRLGTGVTVAGVAQAGFNGNGYVSAVPSPTTFSIRQDGPDATSGGGTIVPVDLGNCITGGAFWDSSSVPASYRGNFFFGDYGSLKLARVTFGRDEQVTSFDTWGTSAGSSPIDTAVGPDGDLYYATFAGEVFRIHYDAKAQGIVASQLHMQVSEAGEAVFSVRLAMKPTEPITVTITGKDADSDVTTTADELTFDATNWSIPQAVHVMAAADADADNDVAELTLAAEGLSSEQISVRVIDDDDRAVLVSPSPLTLQAGAKADVSVVLNGRPRSSVTVHVEVEPDSVLSTSSAELVFAPANWAEPQTVTLQAQADGAFPLDEQVTFRERTLLSATLDVAIVEAEVGDAGGADEVGGAGGAQPVTTPSESAGAEGISADGGYGGALATEKQPRSPDESACSCRVPAPSRSSARVVGLVLALVFAVRRRRTNRAILRARSAAERRAGRRRRRSGSPCWRRA